MKSICFSSLTVNSIYSSRNKARNSQDSKIKRERNPENSKVKRERNPVDKLKIPRKLINNPWGCNINAVVE